jgi:3-keto-5-aminohexanoate cleavage enzyme
MIINASTGGGLGMDDEQKMACLDARPEVASLNLAPEIFKFRFKAREAPIKHPKPAEVADGVVHVTFDSIAMYAQRMIDRGVKPELEFYNPSNYFVMMDLNTMGIILGGHVRVGMEDNVYYKRGQKLENNAEAVARVVRIAHELNREIATPAQARAMMGISLTPSSY